MDVLTVVHMLCAQRRRGGVDLIYTSYTLGADYFAVVAFAIRESHEKGCAFLYFR